MWRRQEGRRLPARAQQVQSECPKKCEKKNRIFPIDMEFDFFYLTLKLVNLHILCLIPPLQFW